MHHYIAVIWNPDATPHPEEISHLQTTIEHSPAGWITLLSARGLTVYSKPPVDRAMRTYVLPGAAGVVIGRLFQSLDLREAVDISVGAAQQIVDTEGKYLLKRYWGNYVAIISAQGGKRHYILRDCSGRIPCYYANHNGAWLFFSSLTDVRGLGLRLTVSDEYLARAILCYPLHVRETGLLEIREALAGDCITISDMVAKQRPLWDPYEVVKNGQIDDYATALARLKDATERTVCAWASHYERILLYLSGGLDSAIVLGCLAKHRLSEKVVCINNFTTAPRGDERHHARNAATMAGATLVEVPLIPDGAAFFEALQKISTQPKPDISHTGKALALRSINAVVSEFQCDTVWTGQGGDHLFLHAPHPYGAADYLLQHKFPRRLPIAIYESALLDRGSVWSVLWTSIRHRLGSVHDTHDSEAHGAAFLTPRALQDGFRHCKAPLQDTCGRLPPGKLMQIRDLKALLNRHRPLVGLERAYQQHPLINQPLIEMSLSVPTYHLQRGGRHRAMARAAFADRVPTSILEREDKGDTTDYFSALLRNSASLLADALLNGYLVSHGILDRAALENVLSFDGTYKTNEFFPLFSCIAAEMWAQDFAAVTSARTPK